MPGLALLRNINSAKLLGFGTKHVNPAVLYSTCCRYRLKRSDQVLNPHASSFACWRHSKDFGKIECYEVAMPRFPLPRAF